MVDKVVFSTDGKTLTYRASGFARAYQASAAVLFSAVFASLGLLVLRNRPLEGISSEGASWDAVGAGMMFLFSACMLAALPIYLRGSASPCRFDLRRGALCQGRKPLVEIGASASIAVSFRSGSAGEYSYLVVIEGSPLPLLEFDQQSEAVHAAELIADHLGLPLQK